MKDYENDITKEELSYELDLMMQGMLYYAGVKKEKLFEACDIYIDEVDDVLDGLNVQGVDEVIAVIEFMKKNHKELFR